MMIFQNFSQLYPTADAELAAAVREKTDLGYHDVRVGNTPGAHLQNFLSASITADAPEYRDRFERHKDLLLDFSTGEMSYASFAARVRRREQGQPEDSDEPQEPDFNPDDIDPHWR